MAKLTVNSKKHIKKSNFGLHINGKDSYPLNDATHVRSAISMFGNAPAKYKYTLAKNIKRRLKQLNMDISISEGTAFYPYAGKYKEKKRV